MASKTLTAPSPTPEAPAGTGTALLAPGGGLAPRPMLPPDQLNGLDEFGPLRNWVSLDAPRGKLVCRSLGREDDDFVGTILESRVVRVMKDEDGNVCCASADRLTADLGRPGQSCEDCAERDTICHPRWWIAWQEWESGLVFAHTLSQMGSLNFQRYAHELLAQERLPAQVLTRIFVEEARRQKTHTVYRRLQFDRMDRLE